MTLGDLASIGSFISGIGVVISLVYLGYQTRQSALTHHAGAYQDRLDFIRQAIRDFMDPELASLAQRVNDGDETLTDLECLRYNAQQASMFLGYEHLIWLHKHKILDQEAFGGDMLSLRGLLTQPGTRASWEIVKAISSPGLRDQVEKYLADTSPMPPIPTAQLWRAHWRTARAVPPA